LTHSKDLAARNLTIIRAYAVILTAVAACGTAAGLALHGAARWDVLLVLAAAALIAEGRGMPLNAIELSVSFIPIVLAAVVFGPAAGALVGFAGMLGDRRGPLERFTIYASSRAIAGLFGGAAALAVEDAIGRSSLLDVLVATLVAGLAYVTVDMLSTMVVGHLRGVVSPRQVWHQLRAAEMLTMALYTPLTALYAFAYGVAGAWVLAFIAIPLLAAHLSYSLYARQSQLIDQLTTTNARLEDANQHLRRVNLSFAAAMVRALDARDAWTAGHSAAVAVYSRDIAREMGMPDGEVEMVHLTGLVHDIGKIGVRAEVLQKTSALNDDEWAEMRRHSEIGANILIEVEGYDEVARIVRSHHERYDGAGYPDGLARDEIPLLARIIAVADAYNAMTSTRPYRNAMAPEVAIQQLLNGRGSQFQSDLVDAFVAVLHRESDSYRLGLLADFSLESMQHPELTLPAPVLRAAVA
jgi:putative nucleotidyltransferase with HDIG domain